MFFFFFFKGVADGVGGWRHYGIDAGEFSSFLMKTCERLVTKGRFLPTNPADLLAKSYNELLESKQTILGECYRGKDKPVLYVTFIRGFVLNFRLMPN